MSRSFTWSSVLPFGGYIMLVSSAVVSSVGVVANALLVCGFALLFATRMRLRKLPSETARRRRNGVAVGDRALVLCATLLFAAVVVDSMSVELDFVEQEGRALIGLLILSLIDVNLPVRARTLDRFLTLLSLLGVVAVGMLLAGGRYRGIVQQEGVHGVFQGFGSSHHVTGLLYASVGVLIMSTGRSRLIRRVALALPAFSVALLTSSRTTLLVLVAAAGIWAVQRAAAAGWNPSPLMAALGSVLFLLLTANALLLVLDDDVAFSPSDVATELDLPSLEAFSQLSDLGPADDRRLGAGVRARNGREANVLIRFQAWRYALQDGLSSPLVGIGPFRFNDLERLYASPVPGVRLAIGAGDENNTDFGAHNLYLQIFAELGLLGIGLLLWLQIGLTRRVLARGAPPFLTGFLLAVIWVSGLVSNSLLSPGLAIALLLPLLPRVDGADPEASADPEAASEDDRPTQELIDLRDRTAAEPSDEIIELTEVAELPAPGPGSCRDHEPVSDPEPGPDREPATVELVGLFETSRVFAVGPRTGRR
ncbi:MAG: O-antigen ligase family protein [Actinomycetota bacterium]